MEGDLIVHFSDVAIGQLACSGRDEVADSVVDVARLGRHATRAKRINRGLIEQVDALTVSEVGDIGDDAADLFIRYGDTLDLEIERITNPRDRRQLQQQSDLALVRALENRSLRVEAEQSRRPPEVGLEDLSDVHTARHAERVENDVDGTAIGEERHVLLGNDTGNDTLVAVASCHLVADRDLSLLGHVNLHELDDARWQLVRLQHAVDPLLRLLLELGLLFVGQVDDGADSLVHLLVFDAEGLEIQ